MRDAIILAIVLGSVPFTLRKPWIGVLMWTWISYMAPHRLCWGVAYDFPVAAVVGGALLLGMMMDKERYRLPGHPLMVVWILFIVWFSLSCLTALNPDQVAWNWERALKIQFMTLVSIMVMNTRERIIALVAVTAFSIGFYGIKGGIFSLATGMQWKIVGPPESFIGGNNEIGLALLIIVPLLWFLGMQAKKAWQRAAVMGSILLCLVSTFSTYSRGALLAMAAMGLFMVMKSRQRAGLILAGVAVAPFILVTLPEEWFARMNTIQGYQQDASALGRINAWHFAFNLASDHPLFGGGFGTFTPRLFLRYAPNPLDFHDAHSIYFKVLGEHGFPGLVLFVAILLGGYVVAAGVVRRAKNDPELKWAADLGAMIQVALIAFCVGGAFLGLPYFDLPYELVGIAVVMSALVNRRQSERQAEAGLTRYPAYGSHPLPDPASRGHAT